MLLEGDIVCQPWRQLVLAWPWPTNSIAARYGYLAAAIIVHPPVDSYQSVVFGLDKRVPHCSRKIPLARGCSSTPKLDSLAYLCSRDIPVGPELHQ